MLALALFLITVVSFTQGFENDCYDKFTCQKEAIWCQPIFDQPKMIVPAPEQVDIIYISYSDIRNMSFLVQFPNLKMLSLFHISINSSLLQEASLTRKFRVVAPSCPGIYFFLCFYFFFLFARIACSPGF